MVKDTLGGLSYDIEHFPKHNLEQYSDVTSLQYTLTPSGGYILQFMIR